MPNLPVDVDSWGRDVYKRQVVIVIPLTLWLPHVASLGVNGVFLAEPISNFIGGGACYVTMLLTIGREMTRKEAQKVVQI